MCSPATVNIVLFAERWWSRRRRSASRPHNRWTVKRRRGGSRGSWREKKRCAGERQGRREVKLSLSRLFLSLSFTLARVPPLTKVKIYEISICLRSQRHLQISCQTFRELSVCRALRSKTTGTLKFLTFLWSPPPPPPLLFCVCMALTRYPLDEDGTLAAFLHAAFLTNLKVTQKSRDTKELF